MTRSIPSIIVLTLMCFTISYGLVRFPDAGILDAAQSVDSPSAPQMAEVWKPPVDGSALRQDNSPAASVLPEETTPSKNLFVEETTQTSANDAADSNNESGALNNPFENEPERNSNPEPEADKSSEDANKNASDNASVADAPADKSECASETAPSNDTELPGLENDSEDELTLIGIPDDDVHSDSMPIETEDNPLPTLDPLDSDIPPVQVPSSLTEAEKEFEPEQKEDPAFEPENDPDMSMTPEQEQAVEDYWNKNLDGIDISNDSTSEKEGESATDSASAQEKQTPAASPVAIPSDPNAQEIPARNREKKPANQDALTLPALDDPQNVEPQSVRPDTGTIPLETFPLDANNVQPVNYTTNSQLEPYDPFGIRVPDSGQIIVRRLPPIEKSIEPIYNNAQLDRFAL